MNFEKITLSERFWQLIRFAVITGIIFAVFFFILNFQAYKTILGSVINPEAGQAKAAALEKSVGTVDIDESLLLPVLSGERETQKSFAWLDNFAISPTDDRLIVPALGINVPIVQMGTDLIEGENWPELEKAIQDKLQQGVLWYPGTAGPGQTGNFFLTGHSSYYSWSNGKYNSVFAQLSTLDVGAEYYVYLNQQKYTYRVIDKKVVDPNDVSVLQQPHDKEIMSMMTCYPTGTVRSRLVTIAEPVHKIEAAQKKLPKLPGKLPASLPQ